MDLAIANVLLIEIILCTREVTLTLQKAGGGAVHLADVNNWYSNNPSFLVKLPLLAPKFVAKIPPFLLQKAKLPSDEKDWLNKSYSTVLGYSKLESKVNSVKHELEQ